MPELGGAPQYLADQLTLFQPGRVDYPHILLLAPQCFSPSGIIVPQSSFKCSIIAFTTFGHTYWKSNLCTIFLLKGGSSGFPSTPAPTPFSAHPGGVRPEDLAAGISRLSVIEESGETIKSSTMASNESSQPNLSQYFGNASEPPATAKEEFFDNFHDAMMQSCRESKIDLTGMDRKKATPPVEAEIVVTAQVIKVR